ncbi:SPFH domain-containing protein [Loktanella sp. DJP18]|uniref:SPFH domain-containing protein n=1 Tax=Loktanella sp. DJP18 TaxID=3409788 RepID=UPI003BB51222
MDPIIILSAIGVVTAIGLSSAIKFVPQSQNYVIERFGRYRTTLKPGPHLIIPGVDTVAHKILVLETQLPAYPIDCITKDNAPIQISVATFYRRVDAELSVYRIADIEAGIQTSVTGIVRSLIGGSDLDAVQANRESLNVKLEESLDKNAKEWGIDITRSEIIDVNFDDETRRALQQQMTAERKRRAVVTQAEGEQRAAELRADAAYYTSQKAADARRIGADAEAYATQVIADAIKENGDEPIRLDLLKRQIEAVQAMGSSPSSKTIMLPSDMTGSLSGLAAMAGDMFKGISAKSTVTTPFAEVKVSEAE